MTSLPRVIHTIETAEPGGAENILVQIASALEREFEPVGVVLENGWTSNALGELGIPVVHMPLERSFDISWAMKLSRYIRANNISLIHSHEFTTNAYATVAAHLAGIPIVCTVHGKNYYPDRLYRRVACRLVSRFADAFVTVSNDLKAYLSSEIWIPGNRIQVIHNGIDTDTYSRDRYDQAAIRKKLSIHESATVLIVVAALFEGKGHRDLVDAVCMLKDSYDDLCVLFVGEGPCEAKLKQQIAQSGLEKEIRLLGFRRDIAELLSVSDLFVLPSYSEGLPVSILEAMSCGVPVIATNVGGVSEIINDGGNALLVPPEQPELLAAKIRLIMQDREFAERLAGRARDDVVAGFSFNKMLDHYRMLYSKLILAPA
jgi:glycosyltransferase involved in cell wall biosynthesis